jgi:predicted ester cyclase
MSVTPIDARQRERREETLRALLEAQNRRDAEASIACFAHPRYELVGNQHVYDGAEEVRRYYEMTFGLFPDLAFEVIATHHSDEVVTAELWMSGSHLGSRTDFEATGKRFRCRMVSLFQFSGDDLVGVRIYYDTGTIVRQLA